MFRFTNSFDKLLDKATNNNQLEADYESILLICDMIRQSEIQPKFAFVSIKKKLTNESPHTVGFALDVLEAVAKNCGQLVHDEISAKSLMEVMRDVLQTTIKEEVKLKTLGLIQSWALTFKSDVRFMPVQLMYETLKKEGHTFPAMKESNAMYSAEVAPTWSDDPKCYGCRVEFGIFTRKHHCRECGQSFCQQCSDRSISLPRFGLEKPVRVCKSCYEKVKSGTLSSAVKADKETLPAEYANSSLSQQKQATKSKEEEEEELNLALAISQSEAEAKEYEKKRRAIENYMSPVKPQPVIEDEENEDPELARYLNRNLWEPKHEQLERVKSPDRFHHSPPSAPETPTHQLENGLSDSHLSEFMVHLKSQVEIFVNRMKSNSSRGRSISNDSSVQGLFLNMTNNHSKLLGYIAQQDELRWLQDKLTQVKDALAALDALREEHQDKLRRDAEEAERQKQIQMAEKLQIMRKKKQEYLQQQRQMAIQRLQDEAREMHMRQQPYMQGMGGYGYPGPYPAQPAPYQPMSYTGYPVHQQHQPPINHRQPLGQLPPMNMMPMNLPQHLQQHPSVQNVPMGQQHPPGMPQMAQTLPPMPPQGMMPQHYPMGPMPVNVPRMPPPAQPYQQQQQQPPPPPQTDQSTAELIRFD